MMKKIINQKVIFEFPVKLSILMNNENRKTVLVRNNEEPLILYFENVQKSV